MNIRQRMINMARRTNPSTQKMTDKEIESHIFLKSAFIQGFKKKASPVLTDMNDYGSNDDRAKRQAILEASYEKKSDLPGTK